MAHVVLNSSLYNIFIFCTIINSIEGDKFIGEYLNNKVKSHLLPTSNNTNHKMWMEYLEKRLEKISMYASVRQLRKRQIFLLYNFIKEISKVKY